MRANYYKGKRDDMVNFIPNTCKKILEIGCGEGEFGAALKSKLNAEVWGVDLSEESTIKAKMILDKVIHNIHNYKVKLLEWISFGHFSDSKFLQFATVAKLSK